MRIVAGKYRSRILKSPRKLALRPTSDKLRETLFNILGAAVEGSVFVDVYAGTGAVGIEALSRGASEVFFIEKQRPAAELIHKNLESLGITVSASILAVDAVKGLEMLVRRKFGKPLQADFVFLDPPYEQEQEYDSVRRANGQRIVQWNLVVRTCIDDDLVPERPGRLAVSPND